jgi:hypothetical protein
MDHTTDKIHIMPLGERWEVEAQSGAPLAHEIHREEAIATARTLAREKGMPCVVLHDGDGVTEEIQVPLHDSPKQTSRQQNP